MLRRCRLMCLYAGLLMTVFYSASGTAHRPHPRHSCDTTKTVAGPSFYAVGYTDAELAHTLIREWSFGRPVDSFSALRDDRVCDTFPMFDTTIIDSVLDLDTIISANFQPRCRLSFAHLVHPGNAYEILIGNNPAHWLSGLQLYWTPAHGCRLRVGKVDGLDHYRGEPELLQAARCSTAALQRALALWLQEINSRRTSLH